MNGNGQHQRADQRGRAAVAFDSDASNLVPRDTNAQMDVFVRDY